MGKELIKEVLVEKESAAATQETLRFVFAEFIQSENDYVIELERILQYKNYITAFEVLKPESIRQLFSNFTDLLNVQWRFSVCIETLLDEDNIKDLSLRIGALFIQFTPLFTVNLEFCRNFQIACEIANDNLLALSQANHLVDANDIPILFLEPIHRIKEYSRLLTVFFNNLACFESM